MIKVWIVIGLLLLNTSFADVIKNYHVNVTILDNGIIDVVETLEMDIDHEDVRLGIIRDIPKSYELHNTVVKTPLTVKSITRNGQPENYWVEEKRNVFEIYTGAREALISNYIPKGKNIYQLHWQSANHIRGFADYDELYFNAIGHGWQFPIEQASIILNLPESVKIIQSAGYFGPMGSRYRIQGETLASNSLEFSAPNALGNGVGMTVAVGFDKGTVAAIEANFIQKMMDKVSGSLPPFIWPVHWMMMFTIVAMFLFWCIGYCLYRLRLPKNHRAFTVRFSPPDLPLDQVLALQSVSAVNNVQRNQVALLTDLAGRKVIEFNQDRQLIVINMIEWEKSQSDLTQGEQAFLEEIYNKGNGSAYYGAYNPVLTMAVQQLTLPIIPFCLQFYHSLLPSLGWLAFGLFIYCVTQYGYVMSTDETLILLFPMFGSLMVWMIIYSSARAGGLLKAIGTLVSNILLVVIGLGIATFALSILWDFNDENNVIASCIIVGLCFVFYCVIFLYGKIRMAIRPEYIEQQQQVLEFKHFLKYTKAEEYTMITPDLFEEYLPYAIGFGVDHHWVKLYQKIYPDHYQTSVRAGAVAISSIGRSSLFTSASTQPSSRGSGSSSGSGSGGGGSSGGGSGGGGGRGR